MRISIIFIIKSYDLYLFMDLNAKSHPPSLNPN